MLGNHQITTLMDSGSTYNFLNSQLADRLGLQPMKVGLLQVTVANGEKLECRGLSHRLLMWLIGEPFVIDFFLLPLEGCEAVLGIQWLQMLGPIWWDFARLLMRFSWKGREISLKGVEAPKHRLVEDVDTCKELKRIKVGWICQLFPLTGWNSV